MEAEINALIAWEKAQAALSDASRDAWAAYYGLKQTDRYYWGSLLNKRPRYTSDELAEPPHRDHTTIWKRLGAKGYEATEVLVTQPYTLLGWKKAVGGDDPYHSLDEMQLFADKHGLCFWMSERPAWHYPLKVVHIEWAVPGSHFSRKRDTAEADEMQRTIYHYKP